MSNNLLLRRRIMMQAGGSPTPPMPYIQNGLIGWWDGLWNVGIEQHDNNSNIWVDLSGNNRDGTLSGNCTWNNDSLNIQGTFYQPATYGMVTFDGSTLPTIDWSWEICFKLINFTICPIQRTQLRNLSISSDGIIGYVRGVNYTIADMTVTHTIAVTCDSNGYGHNIYVDGINVDRVWTPAYTPQTNSIFTSDQGNGYYLNNSNADHLCYRAYNRILDASEVATNYLTDRQRFNF